MKSEVNGHKYDSTNEGVPDSDKLSTANKTSKDCGGDYFTNHAGEARKVVPKKVVITKNPWNNECELCYGRHRFNQGEMMFLVIPVGFCDEPIIVCKICLFSHSWTALDKKVFPVV